MRSSAELNSDGIHIGGSDRESNHHYGNAYEELIDKRLYSRSVVKLMMEVGVADGACLLAWREVFPHALIVGMDIHPSDKARGDRIEFHLGDQRLREDCLRAAGGRMFDMIVEDATHTLENTLLTLFWLWPFVAPGGLYVVEEWSGVNGDKDHIRALWPNVEILGTCGPRGDDEPLVVFRKPR